ncbi:MAG: hypothetical protein KGV50_02665 [Gammaproteobacteria bacterium]|nr:hypothetical protein [Gammaproteobacteria bacterium]
MKTNLLIDTMNLLYLTAFSNNTLYEDVSDQARLVADWSLCLERLQALPYDRIVFALESDADVLLERVKQYPEYKSQRYLRTQNQNDWIAYAINMLPQYHFETAKANGYEADDVIATLTKQAVDAGERVHILSQDKDLYALIQTPQVSIISWIRGFDYPITEQDCLKRWGIKPSLLMDYLALMGDVSDNIDGIGISRNVARRLLRRFGSLEAIYDYGEHRYNPRLNKILKEKKALAFFNQSLIRLKDDLVLSS